MITTWAEFGYAVHVTPCNPLLPTPAVLRLIHLFFAADTRHAYPYALRFDDVRMASQTGWGQPSASACSPTQE